MSDQYEDQTEWNIATKLKKATPNIPTIFSLILSIFVLILVLMETAAFDKCKDRLKVVQDSIRKINHDR